MFFPIWIAVAVIVIGYGCFLEGNYNSDKPKEWDISLFFFIAFLWPVALVIGVISAPFYGLYKLGQLARRMN